MPKSDPLTKAWRQLQRNERAQWAELRDRHKQQRRDLRAKLESAVSADVQAELLAALSSVHAQERRNFLEARRALDKQPAKGLAVRAVDPHQSVDTLTTAALLKEIAGENGIELLASANVRRQLQHIRDHGSDKLRRALGNAVAGVGPGRPKRKDDSRDLAEMRRVKTQLQRRVRAVRTEYLKDGSVRPEQYRKLLASDVLIPMFGWEGKTLDDRLAMVADASLSPAEVATILVAAKYRVPRSLAKRLGRAASVAAPATVSERPRVSAQMSDRGKKARAAEVRATYQ